MNKKIEKINSNPVRVAPLDNPQVRNIISKPNTNGITLIALVITIIVMLILVGVTVNVAINGGLFTTAKRAVIKTEEAKEEEQRLVAMANAAIQEKEWVYTTKDGENIPIPAGFAPTEIEGENSIKEGVVITDAEGNEFVWIPCTSSDYENATFPNSGWGSSNYNGGDWTDEQTETGKSSLKKLEENKDALGLSKEGIGFYIARYEAGIPEDAPFYAYKDEDTYQTNSGEKGKNTDKYIPVSKKGVPAWNFINQTNAKTVSENMYKGKSYLIDSHAWNYICKNILKEKAGKNITNSKDWGNYYTNTTTKYEELEVLYAVQSFDNQWNVTDKYKKGLIPKDVIPKGQGNNRLELATGASEDFKAYNIYDIAGNMWERTTEEGTNSNNQSGYAVIRGGCFGNQGGVNPVAFAQGNYTSSHCRVSIGFRVVIYL